MSGRDSTRAGDEAAVSIDLTDAALRRPADPLDDLTPRALARLAKRADRLRRRDVTRFQQLADETGIDARRLRLLADAWVEGGRSGVHALAPAVRVDEAMMRRGADVIETWRRRHFPLDALEVQVWRNRITVWWLHPGDDPTTPLHRLPLMQLRRTSDARWHVYRRAALGEWWPVVVRGRRGPQSLSVCLDAVRVDALHHFWGQHGPPSDMAITDALPPWPKG